MSRVKVEKNAKNLPNQKKADWKAPSRINKKINHSTILQDAAKITLK